MVATEPDAIAESKLSPLNGEPGREIKRRRRRNLQSSDEYSLSAFQASMSAFHGSSVLARHRRKGKYFTCPTMHPREVDLTAPLFSLEGKSCEFRKKLLNEEIMRLKAGLDEIKALMEASGKSLDIDMTKKPSKVGEAGKGKRSRSHKVIQTVMVGRKNSGSDDDDENDDEEEELVGAKGGAAASGENKKKRSRQRSTGGGSSGGGGRKRSRKTAEQGGGGAGASAATDISYHQISASSMMPF
jgi:uncharacterized membrane protein YgcG